MPQTSYYTFDVAPQKPLLVYNIGVAKEFSDSGESNALEICQVPK